jgi:hypothetical protein
MDLPNPRDDPVTKITLALSATIANAVVDVDDLTIPPPVILFGFGTTNAFVDPIIVANDPATSSSSSSCCRREEYIMMPMSMPMSMSIDWEG